MIYGLYLSAAGVIGSAYRQDVVANNLANSETIGFKRDLPLFQERLSAATEYLGDHNTDPVLESLGGGLLASPSVVDTTPGDLEHTGEPLDAAIQGDGFFAVADPAQPDKARLTRNGHFMLDHSGNLILSDSSGHKVLDADGKPIRIAPNGGAIAIEANGTITQVTQPGQPATPVAKLGIYGVPHPEQLTKVGSTLLAYPDRSQLKQIDATIQPESIERSNVDPTTEMSELMDAQRQLEANANMIHYQDSTLQLLCNNVGKIS